MNLKIFSVSVWIWALGAVVIAGGVMGGLFCADVNQAKNAEKALEEIKVCVACDRREIFSEWCIKSETGAGRVALALEDYRKDKQKLEEAIKAEAAAVEKVKGAARERLFAYSGYAFQLNNRYRSCLSQYGSDAFNVLDAEFDKIDDLTMPEVLKGGYQVKDLEKLVERNLRQTPRVVK